MTRINGDQKALPGPNSATTLSAIGRVVEAYISDNRYLESIPIIERWLELDGAAGRTDRSETLLFMDALGMAYVWTGRLQEGVSQLRERSRSVSRSRAYTTRRRSTPFAIWPRHWSHCGRPVPRPCTDGCSRATGRTRLPFGRGAMASSPRWPVTC